MTEPISLLDLRRKKKPVVLNGGDEALTINGLTARQICDHLERFPALATLSIGGTLSPVEALQATPGALAAWIASSCGYHNVPEAEAAAEENLTIEDASFIVQETMELTFSRGFGPFLTRLGAVMSYITVAPGRAPATRSPMPSPPSAAPPTSASGTSPPASSPPDSSSTSDAGSPSPPPTSSPAPSAPEASTSP
jgi:hypothetical protein